VAMGDELEEGSNMGRQKEEPRGRLAALQDWIAGGGQLLFDQAQSLTEDMQRRLLDVGRGLEEQASGFVRAIEEPLTERVDVLVNRFAITIRRDVDRMRDRVRALEQRLGDVPREGIRELIGPVQSLASAAAERASAVQARLEELLGRIQIVERRASDLTRETVQATDNGGVAPRLDRLDQRLGDLGREVGTKLSEVTAVRERLTRVESRVVENSKDQIARAGEAAGLRDRLARLESRLSDLSKEQLARAVETAGLRERVLRLEQRTGGNAVPLGSGDSTGVASRVED